MSEYMIGIHLLYLIIAIAAYTQIVLLVSTIHEPNTSNFDKHDKQANE